MFVTIRKTNPSCFVYVFFFENIWGILNVLRKWYEITCCCRRIPYFHLYKPTAYGFKHDTFIFGYVFSFVKATDQPKTCLFDAKFGIRVITKIFMARLSIFVRLYVRKYEYKKRYRHVRCESSFFIFNCTLVLYPTMCKSRKFNMSGQIIVCKSRYSILKLNVNNYHKKVQIIFFFFCIRLRYKS